MTTTIRLMIAVALTGVAIAQQPTTMTKVVGKTNPELIEDPTAYLHFFLGFAKSASEHDESFQRRRLSYAQKTGLSQPNIPIAISAADDFLREFTIVRTGPRDLREQVILFHFTSLQQKLGAHDAFVLKQYIDSSVKPRIIAFVPAK
jgi:hypothetical protein